MRRYLDPLSPAASCSLVRWLSTPAATSRELTACHWVNPVGVTTLHSPRRSMQQTTQETTPVAAGGVQRWLSARALSRLAAGAGSSTESASNTRLAVLPHTCTMGLLGEIMIQPRPSESVWMSATLTGLTTTAKKPLNSCPNASMTTCKFIAPNRAALCHAKARSRTSRSATGLLRTPS